MTTLFQHAVTCGHCGARNEVVELASTSAFGSMDLDLRPPGPQRHTLAQQIQHCHACGYCAPDIEERPALGERVESYGYRAILADERLPDLGRKFMAHAHLAEAAGDLADAAWACRYAAWACDDEGQAFASAASACRGEVLRLMEGLHRNDQCLADDPTIDAILALDLLRRSGRFDEVQRRADSLADAGLVDTLAAILAFEQRTAAMGDKACYTVEDAIESCGQTHCLG